MADSVKKSTVVLVVLSSFVLGECLGENTPIPTAVKVGEAVVSNVTSIILEEKLEILHVVEVSKGKGCIAATAKTPYPMSSSMCKEVLAEHGFLPWVDHRNPMMQIEMEAIVPLGTGFVYVRSKRYTGWKIADTD